MFDHPLRQWPTGKIRGEDGIQTFEYVEYEKNILDEIKSIFHSFWRAGKIKNSGHNL